MSLGEDRIARLEAEIARRAGSAALPGRQWQVLWVFLWGLGFCGVWVRVFAGFFEGLVEGLWGLGGSFCRVFRGFGGEVLGNLPEPSNHPLCLLYNVHYIIIYI